MMAQSAEWPAVRYLATSSIGVWVADLDRVAPDSGPRRTGDGYYECVVRDPEGNRVEITASGSER